LFYVVSEKTWENKFGVPNEQFEQGNAIELDWLQFNKLVRVFTGVICQ
jgi:hypothetical protein